MITSIDVETGIITTEAGDAPSFPTAIEDLRAGASFTRAQFCVALLRAGVLTTPEAIAAAKGDWPLSFAAALADLPKEAQDEAQIVWAAATEIHRLHPLIIAMQIKLKWDDRTLDALFGIGA